MPPPPEAAAPPTAASALRRRWLGRAFEDAGIDASRWDPARGVEVNRRTIELVYAYYGRLYLGHDRLEWAGMANMIGPSFYAGFLDSRPGRNQTCDLGIKRPADLDAGGCVTLQNADAKRDRCCNDLLPTASCATVPRQRLTNVSPYARANAILLRCHAPPMFS